MLRNMHGNVGNVLTFIGGSFLAVLGLFGLCIFSTVMGALSGWCVGLFFGDAITGVLAQFRIHGVTVAQLGAFLGFVSPFFRARGSK